MKFGKSGTLEAAEASLPAWGVRVEMSSPVYPSLVTMVTPRMGSAG